MGARITWRDVAGTEGQVELGFGEIYIGRAVECAIRTDDPLVSRRHARIYFQNGAHVIEDLGSANGIYLGDNRTQMHTFQNGDSIRCGNLWLRYINEQPAFAPPMSMSPMPMGGATPSGTQILQVNEPFINPGSSGISRDEPMMPSQLPPMPPLAPPPIPGGGVTPLARPPMPSLGGMPGLGGPYGSPPPPAPPPSPFGSTQMHPGVSGGPPPPMPGPPPPAQGVMVRGGIGALPGQQAIDSEEVLRMQRRIDQLATELRLMRGGGDKATRMEELEDRITRLEKDNRAIEEVANEYKKLAETASGGDMGVSGAKLQLSRAEEVVIGLHDVLSELRINILAAEGEVERFAHILPQASFELVRESLRSSRMQMDSAREWMRMLREVR